MQDKRTKRPKSKLCLFQRNGGCHRNALCNMTGPGAVNCTCHSGLIGDGLVCKSTLMRVRCCSTVTVVSPAGVQTDFQPCNSLQEILTRRLRDFHLGLKVSAELGVAAVLTVNQTHRAKLCFQVADISLSGRGPFTVFVPNGKAYRDVDGQVTQ